MTSRSKFLIKLTRKNCTKTVVPTNLGYLKEALISQVQPLYSTPIQDIDIGGLPDIVDVTYYTRKESKTKD